MAQITLDTNADSPAVLKKLGSTILEMAHEFEREQGVTQALNEQKPVAIVEGRTEIVDRTDSQPVDDTPELTERDLGNGEGAPTSAQQGADAASAAQSNVDLNGVGFNINYCGKAKEPFYASGKRAGQWKKRKGVDDVNYDAWYAAELNALDNGEKIQENDFDVSAAFTETPQAKEAPAVTFEGPGEFMQWVSEKSAAGLLTQEVIGAAYTQLGLDTMAIFTLQGDEQLEAIHGLYDVMAQTAGA